MDFDHLATLLHLKGQLMKLPHLSPIMAHVDAELHNVAAEATKHPVPERQLTKEQEEAAERAEAERARQEEQQAEAARQAKALTPEDIEARQRADAEAAARIQSEDSMKLQAQPRVPDPAPQTDLSQMNHQPGERIEDRNADVTIADRRL